MAATSSTSRADEVQNVSHKAALAAEAMGYLFIFIFFTWRLDVELLKKIILTEFRSNSF